MGYAGEKKRQYQLAWLTERRARGVTLLGGKCVRCGSTENLQFDHVDPATKSPVLRRYHTSSFWSWKWSRVEEELSKCQLLCTPCHRRKTKEDLYPEVHGSHTTYVRHGCRCDACKAAHAATNRLWRQRRKRNVAQ